MLELGGGGALVFTSNIYSDNGILASVLFQRCYSISVVPWTFLMLKIW